MKQKVDCERHSANSRQEIAESKHLINSRQPNGKWENNNWQLEDGKCRYRVYSGCDASGEYYLIDPSRYAKWDMLERKIRKRYEWTAHSEDERRGFYGNR
jgi:hypothetical protein